MLSATTAQKSKLLGFLLSNLQLNDKKLTFSVNYPYNELVQLNRRPPVGGKNKVWCQIASVFQTVNATNVDVYKLEALAQQFNLAGDLLQA